MTDAARARTWLFVPGNRPERFDRAAASGTDQVILDLEDAVEPAAKPAARTAVQEWLQTGSGWVRINGIDTEWWAGDVAALRDAPGLAGIVLPKAEDVETLQSLENHPVVALIETARGLARSAELAAAPGVIRLAFGSIDFALDLGAKEDDDALLYARSQLVLHSRLAGLPAPIDGVTTELKDAAVVRAAADRSRRLGFGAKLCIHPAQLEPVADAFRPSAAELDWARRVLAAVQASAGAVSVDGKMVDRPVLERARRILNE